jgi:hypothetical protein
MLATLAEYLQIMPLPHGPGAVFWAALILIGGALLGEGVYRTFGVPRIVGYSAVGMAITIAGRGVTEGRLDGVLGLIVDLALALLLFELGSRVRLRWLRSNPALLLTSVAESLLSLAAIVAVLHLLDVEINLALACATLTVAASGSVIGRVATELGAAGQVTERMLMLTALNTLFAVLANKLVIGWIHLDVAGRWIQGIAQPVYTFVGSALIAAVLAKVVATVMRKLDLRDENSVLMLLGLIALAVTSARLLNLSTLLVPLIAGAILRNTTDRPWVWPRHFGTAGGVLVLMLFVIVGSAWSVAGVAAGGLLACALLAARWLAKAVAIAGLAHWSGLDIRKGLALTLTMMPISGTTLALFADLHRTHPDFATRLAPIVLTALAIMELIGPIVVQRALRIAGEHQPRARRDDGKPV